MLKQKGITLSGFITFLIIAAFAALIAFKLGPAYLEAHTIKKHLTGIAKDPTYSSGNRNEIERAFGNKALIEKVDSISAKDIEILKEGGGITLTVSYRNCVPLVYNISACMDFSPSTSQ